MSRAMRVPSESASGAPCVDLADAFDTIPNGVTLVASTARRQSLPGREVSVGDYRVTERQDSDVGPIFACHRPDGCNRWSKPTSNPRRKEVNV